MTPPRLFWFRGITALRPAHARYRELAKRLHPDVGGDGERFNEMATEYAFVCDLLRRQVDPASLMPRNEPATPPSITPHSTPRRQPHSSPEMKAAVGQAIDAGASLVATLLREWLKI